MSHYFINDTNVKDETIWIDFELAQHKYHLISNQGVFSKDKLDTGTRILLETVLKHENHFDSMLDLGCGIGVVGTVLSDHYTGQITMIDINERAILLETVLKHENHFDSMLDLGCGIGVVGTVLSDHYTGQITMIDINERAISLAKQNMKNKEARILCHDGIDQGEYDGIFLNPPIRAGKAVIYSLFDQSIEHLSQGGRLWIVIRKQHGANSAKKYLESKGCLVEKVTQDKGFWILKVTKA